MVNVPEHYGFFITATFQWFIFKLNRQPMDCFWSFCLCRQFHQLFSLEKAVSLLSLKNMITYEGEKIQDFVPYF